MILEFADGTQIECLVIFGEPIIGDDEIERDTLTIDFSPETATLSQLTEIFSNSEKTNHLYTYLSNESQTNIKTEIGEGYNKFIYAINQHKPVRQIPGKILPRQFQNVNSVRIAQMTYEEYYPDEVGYNATV